MKSLILENSLIPSLDRLRIAALRIFMKSQILRQIYCDRANRLGFIFLLLSGLYLVISLKWSVILLVLGPMLLGYPHLVASYRFLQRPNLKMKLRLSAKQVFRIFLFLTGVSLFIRFVLAKLSFFPELPYGSWEILLAVMALGLIKIKINSFRNILLVLLTLLIVGFVLNLAWFYPIAFVGFALILHNWVAFGHWYLAAKDFKNRIVVVLATGLFAAIHVLIFKGFFDAWISFPVFDFLASHSFEASGWILAPWTNDPMIWNRMIVIYTFGLSLHYFIWLVAIPQNLDQNTTPNSFRRSLEQLRKDCGEHMTLILFVVAVIALTVWFFTTYAGPIYFGLALLHGWLEFTFLVIAILIRVLRLHEQN